MTETFDIAGYCRISVDEEIDRDNTSIENQKAIIREYVARAFPGSSLTFYEDRDRSGYTFEQREGYQTMRPLLMGKKYDILVVKDFSRFSRRNSRGLVELEDLRDVGVRIISIGDSIDYPTYDDWTAIQFRFLVNEMPVTDASKKVKSVIKQRQEDGKWICAVPYGYVITNSKTMAFEVSPAEAEIVRKIFELYNAGYGYKKIAEWLTERHIPTPRMNERARKEQKGEESKRKTRAEWSIVTVQGIITNDFYIGTLRQGKYTRKKINGADKKKEKTEHIVFEKHHEAIIDDRTFAVAQEELSKRTKDCYRGVKKNDNIYSGFLVCGDCGNPMFAMSRADLKDAYRCGAYHRRGLKGCTSHHTRVDLLDKVVKAYLRRVRDNSQDMIKRLQSAIADEQSAMKNHQETMNILEKQLDDAKEEFKVLTRQKARELMRKPESEDIINETYDALLSEGQARIEGLQNQLTLTFDKRNTIIRVNRIAKTAIEVFDELLEKDKFDKQDLELIVDKIIVYEDHIDVKLKSDIDSLLTCGMLSEETSANFPHDIVDIENAVSAQAPYGMRFVQNATHQKDKVYDVNVISNGDPLEIYTDRDGEVILKKYSPIGEMSSFAKDYTESLFRSLGHIACIVDRDQVVAASGVNKKDLWDKPISHDLETAIQGRQTMTLNKLGGGKLVPVTSEEDVSGYTAQVVSPIIADGEAIGAVLLLSREQGAKMGDTEMKVAETAASIVGRQMEQ